MSATMILSIGFFIACLVVLPLTDKILNWRENNSPLVQKTK